MFRATGKFIAVILAVWLPLFSGNALAMSLAMQAMHGDSHSAVAQQDASHCDSAARQDMHHAEMMDADVDQSTGHQEQQSATDDCGVCHLACCGYLAAASIEVTDAQLLARLFVPVSTQFQSITSTPLDPPPLARA